MTKKEIIKIEAPTFVDMGFILNCLGDLELAITKLRSGGFENYTLLAGKESDGTLFKHPGHLCEKHPGLICSFSPMINNKFENLDLLYSQELGDSLVFYQHSPTESLYIHSAYQIMLKAFDYNALFISFPHNLKLAAEGILHQGHISFTSGLPALSYISEEAVVARDLELCRSIGNKLHFHQISSKRSVELIKRAKQEGISVTCGVSAGHLLYTDKFVDGFNNEYRYLPPLREEEDRLALIEGVKDQTIDVISSGFFTSKLSTGPFIQAEFTSLPPDKIFPFIYNNLVTKNILPLDQVYQLLAINPRKILNLTASNKTFVHEFSEA